tara:strand:+ start:109 stop:222 length:114 start_codon:yes stop_codon:yes gene_type:complete
LNKRLTGLIIKFKKIDEAGKSENILGFIKEMQKADLN